jgi:hypothetical protein
MMLENDTCRETDEDKHQPETAVRLKLNLVVPVRAP